MRPIDADALIRRICGMKCGCEREECGYDEAGCPKVRDIETAPTILRGAVHCGECRYAERRTPFGIKTEIICRLFCAGMKAHDYCSYGAKMEASE